MRCWLADFFLTKKTHNKGWTASPSQTPAAVSVAPNEDVAVGTSDGAARLWTSDPARQAPADDQWQFQVPPSQTTPPSHHDGGKLLATPFLPENSCLHRYHSRTENQVNGPNNSYNGPNVQLRCQCLCFHSGRANYAIPSMSHSVA